jgi:acyl dehydratase
MTLAEVLEARDLELGKSEWLEIGQERIDAFAESTEDRQWIHVDPERAAESELGGTIAHGFLLTSLLPHLFFQVVEFSDMGRMINMGVDKLRFMAPVLSGDAVQLTARIIKARKRSGGVWMSIRGDLHLRSNGKRALVTEMLFLAFPRD